MLLKTGKKKMIAYDNSDADKDDDDDDDDWLTIDNNDFNFCFVF
jgi:hypothetical protein